MPEFNLSEISDSNATSSAISSPSKSKSRSVNIGGQEFEVSPSGAINDDITSEESFKILEEAGKASQKEQDGGE